eukprot:GCRY01000362.1.p1 GENE.GCRY01000362.1~~GCRY01000362.1.p1  ORF type:complete len:488 (-),score=112.96 GCRY01000362.1:100-1563(-)
MGKKRSLSKSDRPDRPKERTFDKKEEDDLQFEDDFADEYDSDSQVINAMNNESDDSEMEDNNNENENVEDEEEEEEEEEVVEEKEEEPLETRAWRPGVDSLAEDETLDYDPSAYYMLHRFHTEWPCLSFDVLRDTLGVERKSFPHTMFLVAGTQADDAANNQLVVVKASDLCKTLENEEDIDAAMDEDSDTEDDPIIEQKHFAHPGGVNRVRSMPQEPNIVATMSDTSHVHIWDISKLWKGSELSVGRPAGSPMFSFKGHADEGFALDWSKTAPGRFLSGDCSKHIYLWEHSHGASWTVDKTPYNGHTSSIEDLQWSPNEKDVFASCSADTTVRVWDARRRNDSVLTIAAHTTDVNVISWNPTASHLIVSGSDDGSFRVWDLRNPSKFLAHFCWHRGPITSVEWSPAKDDSTMLAATSEDNSCSVWDLSVEADAEAASADTADYPPQMLFLHQGQNNLKEVHWHPQIPGTLITTAEDSFNIFQPCIF